MREELKPCPFCGSKNIELFMYDGVQCADCTAIWPGNPLNENDYDDDGELHLTKTRLNELNRRVGEEKLQARIAELEDTVLKLTGRKRILGDETILYAAHKETVAYKDKRIAELEAERDRLREALEEAHITSNARREKIIVLKAERDHFREVAGKLVWLYSDEYREKRDNGLIINGFYSHEWLDMILDMARKALEGAGE